MKLVKLNIEEDVFWVNAFIRGIEKELNDKKCEAYAWKETKKKFPRLRKYDGIKD